MSDKAQIFAELQSYIVEQLGVSAAEADHLRGDYWRRYGSTLLGLVRHHGVRPAHFVRHTHAFPGLESTLVAHAHERLAGTRVRDQNRLDRDWLSLGAGDDPAHAMHAATVVRMHQPRLNRPQRVGTRCSTTRRCVLGEFFLGG